jgi:flagellar basal-body rod protein FlgC
MSFWRALRISTSALSAQRLRLDLIANNIANAETTRTDRGGPYQRQDVVFSAKDSSSPFSSFLPAHQISKGVEPDINGVQVSRIFTDTSAGTRIYDPTHPDANAEGYVEYPNVNMVVEMTNMISASRSYEATLSVIEASRTMALKALEIGS